VRLKEFSGYETEPGHVLAWRLAPSSRAAARVAPEHPAPPTVNQEMHIRGLLAHRESGPGDPHWNALSTDIPGAVDLPALEAAFTEFVRRHGTLHSGFRLDGEEIRRFVVDAETLVLERVDHGLCTTTEEVLARVKALFDSFGDPLDWPPYGFGAVVRESSVTVLMVSDHANVDGHSMALSVAELQELYAAHRDRRASHLGPAPDFVEFCAAERRHAYEDTARIQAATEHWRAFAEACGGAPPILPIDLGVQPGESLPRVCDDIELLDGETARAFSLWCRENGGSFFSGLLAALGRAAHEIDGEEIFRTIVPLSTRDEPRWASSMGWFANSAPIEFPVTATFGETVAAAHASLRAAFRHVAVPFPRIMRKLGTPFRPVIHRPLSLLNYQDFTQAPGSEGLTDWNAYLLTNASVGDQLHVFINRTHQSTYVHARYPDTVVARKGVRDYAGRLGALITGIVSG
jgi:mycolipenoyl-CoA---2-(long-chain-fatty acyl)-trehalose mycolipenoyltransferase / long-chain-acyl-CoA---trehalose acyltransferase